jgi:hypothetical protein
MSLTPPHTSRRRTLSHAQLPGVEAELRAKQQELTRVDRDLSARTQVWIRGGYVAWIGGVEDMLVWIKG